MAKRFKKMAAVLLVAGLMIPTSPGRAPAAATDSVAREVASPPGQVVVVTLNAKQIKVLGVDTFRRLYNLTLALRNRPVAFNGGPVQAVSAPDVLVIQEMTFSNLEIFHKLLNQRSGYVYEIAWEEGVRPKFLYNSNAVTLLGPPTSWLDPCQAGPDDTRKYQFARFVDKASGLPFTVAGIHFLPRYSSPTPGNCRMSNVTELRRQLIAESGPVIVGGDFNQRAVEAFRECDPDERSAPADWWSLMTSSILGGPTYSDAVQSHHRRTKTSMVNEWTFQGANPTVNCDGLNRHRRARIDYLFAANAVVAEAHADHPGWAGQKPGTRHPVNKRYSDHRFVNGRFVLGAAGRPKAPSIAPRKAGAVELDWAPVDQATRYVLYRALGSEPYAALTQLDATTTGFVDSNTAHGVRYRYAVAAVGPDGGQGLESPGKRVVADAQGPRVSVVTPWAGATRVPRNSKVVVRFNEGIAKDSVTSGTIELIQKPKWKNGRNRRIAGRVTVTSSKTIEFKPARRLDKKRTFVVKVRGVRDKLGNPGRYFQSSFSTWR